VYWNVATNLLSSFYTWCASLGMSSEQERSANSDVPGTGRPEQRTLAAVFAPRAMKKFLPTMMVFSVSGVTFGSTANVLR